MLYSSLTLDSSIVVKFTSQLFIIWCRFYFCCCSKKANSIWSSITFMPLKYFSITIIILFIRPNCLSLVVYASHGRMLLFYTVEEQSCMCRRSNAS